MAEKQEVSDWREIRSHSDQSLAHFDNVLLHFYVLVLSNALFSLLDVLNDHRVD